MGFGRELSKKKEGILIVSVLFVILLSFIGLTLLTHSISHTKIQKARQNKTAVINHMTQKLIFYLHHLREKVFEVDLNIYPSPENDYFNRNFFPDFKKNPIVISNSFFHHTEKKLLFNKTRISDSIQAISKVNNYQLQAGVLIDILSGKIPLDFFPLFLNKKIEDSQGAFLDSKGIIIEGSKNFIVSDTPVEFHISDFLIDSLKISGEILNWENIRKKFGLEIKDEPIEKGIYFIVEEDTLESIFIQDDLQRMIFSAENGLQVIQFYIAGELFELSYTPDRGGFFYWDNQIKNDSFFKEKIVINGNVWSLEQKNDYAFHEDSNLTLLVSGKTIIRTDLRAEHIDIKKVNIPRLTLINSNNSLFNSTDQSEVIIGTQGKTITEVNLIVNGSFSNQCTELEVHGNIFSKELNNKGMIKIFERISNSGLSGYFHTENFTCAHKFLIDHLEEVHDVK